MNEDFTWFCPSTYEILSSWNVTIAQQRKIRDTLIVHHNGPGRVNINYKHPSANHILLAVGSAMDRGQLLEEQTPSWPFPGSVSTPEPRGHGKTTKFCQVALTSGGFAIEHPLRTYHLVGWKKSSLFTELNCLYFKLTSY